MKVDSSYKLRKFKYQKFLSHLVSMLPMRLGSTKPDSSLSSINEMSIWVGWFDAVNKVPNIVKKR